jgi:hypothetical protein
MPKHVHHHHYHHQVRPTPYYDAYVGMFKLFMGFGILAAIVKGCYF